MNKKKKTIKGNKEQWEIKRGTNREVKEELIKSSINSLITTHYIHSIIRLMTFFFLSIRSKKVTHIGNYKPFPSFYKYVISLSLVCIAIKLGRALKG